VYQFMFCVRPQDATTTAPATGLREVFHSGNGPPTAGPSQRDGKLMALHQFMTR